MMHVFHMTYEWGQSQLHMAGDRASWKVPAGFISRAWYFCFPPPPFDLCLNIGFNRFSYSLAGGFQEEAF